MRSTGLFDSAYAIDRQLRLEGYDPDALLTVELAKWAFRHAAAGARTVAAFCQKRHDLFVRRGYYWEEKLLREAKEKFILDLRALSAEYALDPEHPDAPVKPGYHKRYSAILDAFEGVRRAIEREGEERRLAAQREHGGPPPWYGPRAMARRERFRARREGSWSRWAAATRDAIARGFAPPSAPGARRRSGAPIRRLCACSVNPPPSRETLVEAYRAARGRGRVEEKIRCGSMLLDAEASVDSSLRRTETGEIVGRNPGLRGWIGDRAPWLLNHYVTLMKWRRLAQEFRESHGLRDPYPATVLLADDAPGMFPEPVRSRLAAARREARELLESAAGRTVKDLRAALARREWRRTG